MPVIVAFVNLEEIITWGVDLPKGKMNVGGYPVAKISQLIAVQNLITLSTAQGYRMDLARSG